MKIEKDRVVTIHYTLTDEEQNVIDSSSGGDPLGYLHGAGNLIPGLEAELEGRVAGDAFRATIRPEDGYGVRDEARVHVVDRARLPEGDLAVGMQMRAESEHEVVILTITDIAGEQVTLDANHPLAGVTLFFDVTVVEVRAATAEELAHGHVHGPGGHHH
jgi:FKBP-type peptidyl-prolyl cis-trans isomerase SlyD